MEEKIIKIACDGTRYIPLADVEFFQGNLKDVTRTDLDRIKRMLIKDGLCSPLFLWEGRPVSLDGHQRTIGLRELASEGWKVPDLPAINVMAESAADAAKKVLIYNSRYAKIIEEGLYEFLNVNDVDISGISTDIQLQDIDMEKFLKGWGEDGDISEFDTFSDAIKKSGEENNVKSQYGIYIQCSGESEQEKLLGEFSERGLNCKALVS